MFHRSLASLFLVATILSTQAQSQTVHEQWMKFFTGKWSWKSTDGNHGTVEFEKFRNSGGQTVKEYCQNLDKSALMTHGWRSDKKAIVGAGFDSDGNYLETHFTKIDKSKMEGHRIRTGPDGEAKDKWKITKKTENEYELIITNGKVVTATVTRQ